MNITFQKNSLRASTVVELVISLVIVGAGIVVLASALTDNVKMFKYRENRHTAQIVAENVSAVVSSLDVEDFDCLLRSATNYTFTRSNQAWLNDWIQDPIRNIEFEVSLFDANNNPVTGANHPRLGAISKHHRILNTTVTYRINPKRELNSTFTSSIRMPPLDRLNGSRQNSWRALRSSCSPALPAPANVPTPRAGIFTAVWTGTEAIVWGGYEGSSTSRLNTGGRYNPSTDTWTTVSPPPDPIAIPGRDEHYATWTGDRMLIWGGGTRDSPIQLTNTGGLYNPQDNSWVPTQTTNAPVPRCCFAGAWTGSKLIVWGGGGSSGFLNNGGVYTPPPSNSWELLPSTGVPIPGADNLTGVWTGSSGPSANKFMAWGGRRSSSAYSRRGVVYDLSGAPPYPVPVEMSTINAPAARHDHISVWTGTEILIWGGENATTRFNTGGLYNPATDTWRAISTDNAPSPRVYMAANSEMEGIWTGKYLLIWGGQDGASPYNDGGWYDPATDKWKKGYDTFRDTWIPDALSPAGINMASKRRLHGSTVFSGLNLPVGIWIGSEAFFFGGSTSNLYNSPSNTYGIFAP